MYHVVFANDVAEDFVAVDSPLQRKRALSAIQCLPLEPDATGIGDVVDTEGRVHRIAVTGGVAFVFRADHALRQIQVMAVHAVNED